MSTPDFLAAEGYGRGGIEPLHNPKRLRLQEAQRLMLGEGLDAAEAGFRVGYESGSQFSREDRRLFGARRAGT
jgi:AraC-like DNA-binding protein